MPCHRHVLWIAGTKVVVALIGACSAPDTDIHKHLERAILAQQFAHFVDGLLFPVIRFFARETKVGVMSRGCRVGFIMSSGPMSNFWNDDLAGQFICFYFVSHFLLRFTFCPWVDMTIFPAVVYLVAGGRKEYAAHMHKLGKWKINYKYQHK